MSIIQMADLDIDDITYLTSNDNASENKLRRECGPFCRNRRNCKHHHHHKNGFNFTFKQIMLSLLVLFLIVFALVISIASQFKSDRCALQASTESNISMRNINPRPELLYATNGELFPWNSVKLPKFIKPVHYDIFMHPNLSTFINRGSVEVIFYLSEPSDFLIIHSKELNITHVSLSNDVTIDRILEYRPFEQLYLGLSEKIIPYVNYSLKLNFTKCMEERLEGFYISSYMLAGKKHYLATTHFEPTSARSAFPCFDEPLLKATFALKIVHESHYDALFNAEKLERIQYNAKEELMLSVFDNTVRMSTYLVCFVVCDFKSNKDNTRDGTVVSSELRQAASNYEAVMKPELDNRLKI